MKERLKLLIKIYLWFLLLCIIQKPVFVLFHNHLFEGFRAMDLLQIIAHGLPLDLSVTAYVTSIPLLLAIVSVWVPENRIINRIGGIYVRLITFLVVILTALDLSLYSAWGFRLDATPMFYILSSPKDAAASVSMLQWFVGGGTLIIVFVLLELLARHIFPAYRHFKAMYGAMLKTVCTVLLLLIGGCLFLLIRGGLGVSTLNTGRVYYSTDVRKNHAAINPVFSLLESLGKQQHFDKQYRFLAPEKADALFKDMQEPAASAADSIPQLLNNKRPNIIFVVMESFSSRLMTALGGEPDIAVNLDELSKEGILFTNFYANSFRTDRGLVAILSGYPAQPTTSVMKYPSKSQTLPSITASLRKEGYRTNYYYGGDANFTNMHSYLASTGFETLVSDVDFHDLARESKWGAHDHHVFERLYEDLEKDRDSRPFFKVLQTSSSHEPFEVPYKKHENIRLNAFSYTDSCIGNFVKLFKKLPQWDNTLLLFVPDHVGCYPEYLNNFTLERYQIPMLWIGGAVKRPCRIDTLASQHDIAATLLGQLGISHTEFTFSKNLMNPRSPHFAFFTVPDAWGMVNEKGAVIYDNSSDKVVLKKDGADEHLEDCGKAYLQKLYDDLASR